MIQTIAIYSNPPAVAVSTAKVYTVVIETRAQTIAIQVNRPVVAVAGVGAPYAGPPGQRGFTGDTGKSAYELALDNDFVGTEADWLLSLVGASGDDGLSAYQVAVNEGFVGDEAAWLASLVGPPGADSTVPGPPGLDSFVPGPTGDDGLSAYQVAVNTGFAGDEAAWLLSLKGASGENSTVPGPAGDDGLSAYQVAVSAGFVGSEAAWLDSLVGPPGADSTVAGPAGVGVPTGGATGQVLAKASATDYATEWIDPPAGTGGGEGDVTGPASASVDNFAAFDGTTGKLIKDSGSNPNSFASAAHDHDEDYAAALSADDNYVTNTEKAALHGHANKAALDEYTGPPDLSGKQDELVSGTNIKTINGVNVLGSGNIVIPVNNITISASDPSGGNPGDIWIKYIP